MNTKQPVVLSERGRLFPTAPIAVQAVVLNEHTQILMLSSPRRNGANGWQIISGGLEAGETVIAGVLREVREEAGPVKVRPLGVLHAQSFHYDRAVQFMIGITFLLAFEGGAVVPGDDMQDAVHRWWPLAELERESAAGAVVIHPSTRLWILRRAVNSFHRWSEEGVGMLDFQHRLALPGGA